MRAALPNDFIARERHGVENEMKFTEAQLEKAIIDLLGSERYRHIHGASIQRAKSEVLLKDDLKEFLLRRYKDDAITESEVDSIIRRLEMMSPADLNESNKAVMKMVSDGLLLKREDR